MRADFHIHSDFSEDSDTPMSAMVQRGIYLGLETMCFTEHYDHDFPQEFGDFSLDICSYYERCLQLRQTYASHIDIRFGVELGMQKHLADYYADYVSRFPFDYVIASQHLADRIDPYYPLYWETRDAHTGICTYFEETLENIRLMKDYDALGHMDYIVRYAPGEANDYSYAAYADYIDPILKHLIDKGKCLEVNTAGFKYGLDHPNPTEDVLRRYLELGGELISIGSDAHKPEHLAFDFPRLQELLTTLGFRYYCTFKNREAAHIALDR